MNAGSHDISVFRVMPGARLELTDVEDSRGQAPYSITVHEGLVYVLNNGGAGNIAGFTLDSEGELAYLEDSVRPLSGAPTTDPGQVLFSPDGSTLVVTEKATDILDSYTVGSDGYATGPMILDVSDPDGTPVTPFGGAFTQDGVFVVTEAHGGLPGQAAASSYRVTEDGSLEEISDTVGNGETDVCWTVISENDDFAFITNFGSGTISSYQIGPDGSIAVDDAVAARTADAQGPRDFELTPDGRFIYAIEIGFEDDPSLPDEEPAVFGFQVGNDGGLQQVDVFGRGRLPDTIAGLATF